MVVEAIPFLYILSPRKEIASRCLRGRKGCQGFCYARVMLVTSKAKVLACPIE
jgi:hypothetical protein